MMLCEAVDQWVSEQLILSSYLKRNLYVGHFHGFPFEGSCKIYSSSRDGESNSVYEHATIHIAEVLVWKSKAEITELNAADPNFFNQLRHELYRGEALMYSLPGDTVWAKYGIWDNGT